jgi:hypothetical protein
MQLPARVLSAGEVRSLEACYQPGPHPRMRRALAILGHHRGPSLPQLATLFAVRYATVQAWLQAWQRHALAGVAEGRRSGRPRQLAAAAEKSKGLAWQSHPTSASACATPDARSRG